VETSGELVVALFAVVMTGVVTFLVIREWYSYRHGNSLVGPAQFRYRVTGAAVLYGLVLMMCLGVYVVDFTSLALFAAYWITFGVLSAVPVVMSLLDLRTLSRARREHELALRRDMVRFIHEHADAAGRQASLQVKAHEAEAMPGE